MKKNFKDEGRSRLESAPKSLEDFLDTEKMEKTEKPKTGKTEKPKTGKTEKTEKPKTEKTKNTTQTPKEKVLTEERTERYEWRHTSEMSGRLQRLLLERNQQRPRGARKVKLVNLIEEAVEELLEQHGY